MEDADQPDFAYSLRLSREQAKLSREALMLRLASAGWEVSVSKIARWERTGSIKAEDAYYLTEIYGITLEELLMRTPSSERLASAASSAREAEEAAREAEALTGDAPDEDDPPRDEDEPQPGRFG